MVFCLTHNSHNNSDQKQTGTQNNNKQQKTKQNKKYPLKTAKLQLYQWYNYSVFHSRGNACIWKCFTTKHVIYAAAVNVSYSESIT